MIHKIIPFIFILFTIFQTPFLCGENTMPESIIRVSIVKNTSQINLQSPSGFLIFDLNTGEKKRFNESVKYLIQTENKKILIDKISFSAWIRIIPLNEQYPLTINERKYRDTVLIRCDAPEKITAINEIDIDHYLYGILPKEVGFSWPLETLKAQAIVSRTFALKNLKRHESEGFNLCNEVHCQVFGGLEGEKPETNIAVDQTHNEVLIYKKDIINSFFFANCGGRTETSYSVWEGGNPLPYLQSIRCKYCSKSKHFEWKSFISQKEISEILKKKYPKIQEPIQSIKIKNKSKSGRVTYLQIQHANGKIQIKSAHFRQYLGAEKIKSTLITSIKKNKNGFNFNGKGWGHGVGFCQDGAKGLGDKGKNYKQILKHYFPKASIEKVSDD